MWLSVHNFVVKGSNYTVGQDSMFLSSALQFDFLSLNTIIAERLSARQLIVQCGLKSQLAYIYIYIYIYVCVCATSIMLRNAIKSPVTFLIRVITMSVRSVYVLLLQL